MLSHIEVSEALSELYEKYLDASFGFLKEVKNTGEEQEIAEKINLVSEFDPGFIYIQTGIYEHIENHKSVRFYNPGDFITLHESYSNKTLRIESSMPGTIVYFPKGTFLLYISARPTLRTQWMEVESLRTRVIELLCGQYCRVQNQSEQGFKNYAKGAVIIEEGSKPFAVYQLIRGSAEVSVGGKTVAELKSGEIFGETSFLTDSLRTATVTAASDCQIRITNKESFFQLLESDPAFCSAIATQLAHRISAMGKNSE